MLRREAEKGREEHALLEEEAAQFSDGVAALAETWSQDEGRLAGLEHAAAEQRGRHEALRARTGAQVLLIPTLRQELAAASSHHAGHLALMGREASLGLVALGQTADTLRGELQQSEQALELQLREIGAVRERAYRSEAHMQALKGQDLAEGLRTRGQRRDSGAWG